MISATAIGRLGKDAETRHAGQSQVVSFSIAAEVRKGRERVTQWIDCSLWGARGQALLTHLTKGTKVAVTGDFSIREHNGKTYLQIEVQGIELLGGGAKQEDRPARRRQEDDEYADSEPPF